MEKKLFLIAQRQFIPGMLLLIASFSEVNAQLSPSKNEPENYPPVSVPNTELRSIRSNLLGQELNLYILLPLSYTGNQDKLYQVWYFTDANRSFPLVANIESIFDVSTTKPVEPEIIIVGIGYKIKDMGDWAAWRTRDLTPTNVPGTDSFWENTLQEMTGRQYTVRSGGAAKFIDVIAGEVFPFIESNYRASPRDRGLGGYSYGGLFTLYVLLTRPELFNLYYAGSPSIQHDNGVLFKFEQEYADSHKDLNAKLFMSAGGLEDSLMISNMNKMDGVLLSRNYPGLVTETHVFPGETHQSCMPSSVMRAFRILYKR